MPITQQALDVHQAMSSRHWCATEEYRTKCKNQLEKLVEKKHDKKVWKWMVKAIAEKKSDHGWSRVQDCGQYHCWKKL